MHKKGARHLKTDRYTKSCYDDILNLPHHVSVSHPHMPLSERAAQFSPFAALSGHREAVKKAERIVSERKELDENAKSILNGKLQYVLERTADELSVQITRFEPDAEKNGGIYKNITGCIKKADSRRRVIILQDGLEIPIDDITDIQGTFFDSCEYL